MTLGDWAKHFENMYGRRNRLFRQDLGTLSLFLLASWRGLQGGVRSKDDTEVIRHLSSLVGWIFAIVNRFNGRFHGQEFSLVVTTKYSRSGCPYCRSDVCSCRNDKRPSAEIWPPSYEQAEWSLERWQEYFLACYGEKNKKQGLDYVIGRLAAEIAELCSCVVTIPMREETIAEIELELALELADVFAWSCATASLLGLNLEQVVLTRYSVHCPVCKEIPCSCDSLAQERATLTRLGTRSSEVPTMSTATQKST